MRKDAALQVGTEGLVARLRAVHLAILCLIALLAAGGHLMTLRALDRNRSGAELVDLANRVGLNSQKLVSYSQALADQTTSPWARRDLSARLEAGIAGWDRDVLELESKALREGESTNLRTALGGTREIHNRLAALFRQQLRLPASDPKALTLAQSSMRFEEAFLQQLAPVTQELRSLAATRDAAVRLTMWGSVLVILAALAVEGLVIFRPMTVRLVSAIRAQRELQISESVRLSEERLRAAIEGSFDAFFLMNAVHAQDQSIVGFKISEANSIAAGLLGRPRDELIGISYEQILPQPLALELLPRFAECLAEGVPFRMEIEVDSGGRRPRWLELQVAPVPDGLAVTARDLTAHKRSVESLREEGFELRAANAQLSQLAVTDSLTGLYNRRALLEMLEDEAEYSKRSGAPLGVIMADLDNFKELNDRFGHMAGDQVLKAAAEVIRNGLRPTDFAVRYGGEEFAIVLRNTDLHGTTAMAERVRKKIEACPVPHGPVTISLGVASGVPSSLRGEDLLRDADAALYRAKRAGKNTTRSTDPRAEILSRREG